MGDQGIKPDSFWDKVRRAAIDAGKEVIEKALRLFYAFQDSDTPAWAKTVIAGALLYFINIADAVPDFVPGGYIDDLGALAAALTVVAAHIKQEHIDKAHTKLKEWFGDELEDKSPR